MVMFTRLSKKTGMRSRLFSVELPPLCTCMLFPGYCYSIFYVFILFFIEVQMESISLSSRSKGPASRCQHAAR